MKFILTEIVSFKTLQALLLKSFYLIHFNLVKQLYIDLNVFKFFDFDVMIYYIKKEIKKDTHIKKDAYNSMKKNTSKTKIFSSKFLIQFIIKLSSKSDQMHFF